MPPSRSNLTVSVWRGKERGRFVADEVPVYDNQTVLDVVTWLQRHRVPALGRFGETDDRSKELV